jgi:hypothetical protein
MMGACLSKARGVMADCGRDEIREARVAPRREYMRFDAAFTKVAS